MNNLETLRFGFVRPENGPVASATEPRLSLLVPDQLFDASQEVPGVQAALAQSQDVLAVEKDASNTRLTVVAYGAPENQIERLKRNMQLGKVLTIFDALDNVAHPDHKDPTINISTHDRIGRSQNTELRVRLQLPEILSDTDLTEVATTHMLALAKQLDYKPGQDSSTLVKAIVSRVSDIQLHADSKRFAHSLSSDVRVVPQSSERLLTGHGLHSNERKFICIAGAVAIAHAAELL